MRRFSDAHPAVIALYYLTAAGIAMISWHPVLLGIALAGSVLCSLRQGGRRHGAFAVLFLITAAVNPILSQNGVTVLFLISGRPVTAEACAYGLAAAAMIVSVLYRFSDFTAVMTADKILCICARLSPGLSLIVSMAMRYVPLFARQAGRIRETQTALGLYKEENLPDRARGGLRIFSVMMGWALENGIVTADSMAARGYGAARRSHLSLFRFRLRDGVFTAMILVLTAVTGTALAAGALRFDYYPAMAGTEVTPLSVLGLISYGILSLFPILCDTEAIIRWKYLTSKI